MSKHRLSFWRAAQIAYLREMDFLSRSFWDRALLSWIPLLLVIILAGVFVGAVPKHLPTLIVNQDSGEQGRKITRLLKGSPSLNIIGSSKSLNQGFSELRALNVVALVHIPEHTSAQINEGKTAEVFAFYNANLSSAGQTSYRAITEALQATSADIMIKNRAFIEGPASLHAVPIAATATVLFNPARNFEIFLVGLIIPGILHLMLCLLIASALCRELRDKTAQHWLNASDQQLLAAIFGKALPYLFMFTLYGAASVLYIGYLRGDGIAGSTSLLILGHMLMYFAYAGFALLVVGITKSMPNTYSAIGLYAGTSLAFCGATFPIDGASLFARLWHHLLPFTSYVKLDAAERYWNAPLIISASYLASLLAFCVVFIGIGFIFYQKAINNPDSWGQK